MYTTITTIEVLAVKQYEMYCFAAIDNSCGVYCLSPSTSIV